MHAKKLLTYSAAAVMALSLTACGNQPQTAGSESTASIHEETSASATATEAVTEATTQGRITILEVSDVSEIDKSYFKAQAGTGATNTIMNVSKMTHKEVFDQLVENFGIQEILVGDSIDLRNYCDYDSLSDDEKEQLNGDLSYSFNEYAATGVDTSSTPIHTNHNKNIICTYRYDTANNLLRDRVSKYSHDGGTYKLYFANY
jgi:hypothetical protein